MPEQRECDSRLPRPAAQASGHGELVEVPDELPELAGAGLLDVGAGLLDVGLVGEGELELPDGLGLEAGECECAPVLAPGACTSAGGCT